MNPTQGPNGPHETQNVIYKAINDIANFISNLKFPSFSQLKMELQKYFAKEKPIFTPRLDDGIEEVRHKIIEESSNDLDKTLKENQLTHKEWKEIRPLEENQLTPKEWKKRSEEKKQSQPNRLKDEKREGAVNEALEIPGESEGKENIVKVENNSDSPMGRRSIELQGFLFEERDLPEGVVAKDLNLHDDLNRPVEHSEKPIKDSHTVAFQRREESWAAKVQESLGPLAPRQEKEVKGSDTPVSPPPRPSVAIKDLPIDRVVNDIKLPKTEDVKQSVNSENVMSHLKNAQEEAKEIAKDLGKQISKEKDFDNLINVRLQEINAHLNELDPQTSLHLINALKEIKNLIFKKIEETINNSKSSSHWEALQSTHVLSISLAAINSEIAQLQPENKEFGYLSKLKNLAETKLNELGMISLDDMISQEHKNPSIENVQNAPIAVDRFNVEDMAKTIANLKSDAEIHVFIKVCEELNQLFEKELTAPAQNLTALDSIRKSYVILGEKIASNAAVSDSDTFRIIHHMQLLDEEKHKNAKTTPFDLEYARNGAPREAFKAFHDILTTISFTNG